MGALYRDLVRKHSRAKGSARALLNILADYATDEGLAWPARSTLANDTGMSERNVTRCLQTLCDDARLTIAENAKGGRGRVPVYKILIPELEKGDRLSPKRETDCHPLDEKRVTNEQIKGDKSVIKGDKCVENQSYAGTEPQLEPKQEPMREGAPATPPRTHQYFDPRKFVDGKVPAGNGTTPAEVFYEIHTVKDDRQVLSSHALETITAIVDNLDWWRTVVSAWELSSFKATNVSGQLDWYRDGIPDKQRGASTAGKSTNNGVSAISDYIKERQLFSERNR